MGHITDYNTIRNEVKEGAHSIIQNLPIPSVKDLNGFAYIPLQEVVNLSLALGLDIRQYKDGKDWEDKNVDYEGEYFANLHRKVKESSDILEGSTRVCNIRCWSDGFQDNNIKEHNQYNNMQLFTVNFLGKNGQNITWPFALGFKAINHSPIMDRLWTEAKQLKKHSFFNSK